MAQTYTHTSARTRAEAVQDQVDMFLQYAGISDEKAREGILKGISEHWLTKVGVYLVENGKRFLEVEVALDWQAHADFTALTPEIRTDLPGWADGAAPEVRTLGRRFGLKARELGITPSYWVVFTNEIHADPERYRQACMAVVGGTGGTIPDWRTPPQSRSYTVEDLAEVSVAISEAR
jgi:hypothetical protein